ncbi:MAG: efflux RND transporter periplasmic adaptor subunit, partial [Tardiphaga sp.]
MTDLNTRSQWFSGKRLILGGCVAAVVVAAGIGFVRLSSTPQGHSDVSSQSRKNPQRYATSAAEWASLTIEPVTV